MILVGFALDKRGFYSSYFLLTFFQQLNAMCTAMYAVVFFPTFIKSNPSIKLNLFMKSLNLFDTCLARLHGLSFMSASKLFYH